MKTQKQDTVYGFGLDVANPGSNLFIALIQITYLYVLEAYLF